MRYIITPTSRVPATRIPALPPTANPNIIIPHKQTPCPPSPLPQPHIRILVNPTRNKNNDTHLLQVMPSTC